MSLKLFELDKSEATLLASGQAIDEHQKAFFGLLGGEAIHIDFDMKIAFDCLLAGGLFQRRLDTTDSQRYSLKLEDYPKLPLFDRTGRDSNFSKTTVLLKQLLWLVFAELSTWRSLPAGRGTGV